jgi:hypothetical protein
MVYWLAALSIEEPGTGMINRLRAVANKLVDHLSAEDSDVSNVSHMAVTYGRVLFTDWGRDTRNLGPHLLALYNRAMRIGAFDSAGHTASVYCQSLLFNGVPLATVHQEMTTLYRSLAQIGQERNVQSILKYQVAVASLIGSTDRPNPTTGALTGDEEREAALERSGDALAIAGLRVSRLMVAAFFRYTDAVHHISDRYTLFIARILA